MIVYDLRCGGGHVFEAWFGSSEDFGAQQARGLVACPICEDRSVEKAVMAPAVGAKGNRLPSPAAAKLELKKMAALQARIETECDYVGAAFADEARVRHEAGDAEKPARGIFGEATVSAAMDLIADGIPVAPLPFRPRHATDA